MTPDQREEYEERAAIMQYDGKLDRETAERMAMECVENASRTRQDGRSAISGASVAVDKGDRL